MALFSVGGNIPKVKIESFDGPDFGGSEDAKAAKDRTITLPLVTSEAIVQKYGVKWGDGNEHSAIGESAPILQFKGYGDAALEINTIIDATGVYRVESKEGDGLDKIKFDKPSIQEYITHLKKLVYSYNEETHQACYIKLTWGKIFESSSTASSGTISGVFKGVLQDMEISYELFSSDGTPVRAKVKMTFLPLIDPRKRPGGNSPDLTHIIEVKPGDNLAKLCNKIYDNSEYYHQVAQANGLASAYAIKPGMKLLFPPLDKNTR
jgi:hypothetical protein